MIYGVELSHTTIGLQMFYVLSMSENITLLYVASLHHSIFFLRHQVHIFKSLYRDVICETPSHGAKMIMSYTISQKNERKKTIHVLYQFIYLVCYCSSQITHTCKYQGSPLVGLEFVFGKKISDERR